MHAALDAGITFFDTAPVYGDDGFGETILAEILGRRDDVVLTTKCGYDIDAPRIAPGHSERPQDWRPESVRAQLEASLRRLGRDHIDLLPAAQRAHRARARRRRCGTSSSGSGSEGQGAASSASRSAPRSAGSTRALDGAANPADRVAADGVQPARAGARAARSRPSRRCTRGGSGLIARVPHASDVLSGKVTRDTEFEGDDHRAHRKRENLLDLFDKADTLAFLHGAGTGRTIGQAAVAGILAFDGFTTVLPTCVTADEVREYAAASELPLTADEKARGSTSCGQRTSASPTATRCR